MKIKEKLLKIKDRIKEFCNFLKRKFCDIKNMIKAFLKKMFCYMKNRMKKIWKFLKENKILLIILVSIFCIIKFRKYISVNLIKILKCLETYEYLATWLELVFFVSVFIFFELRKYIKEKKEKRENEIKYKLEYIIKFFLYRFMSVKNFDNNNFTKYFKENKIIDLNDEKTKIKLNEIIKEENNNVFKSMISIFEFEDNKKNELRKICNHFIFNSSTSLKLSLLSRLTKEEYSKKINDFYLQPCELQLKKNYFNYKIIEEIYFDLLKLDDD